MIFQGIRISFAKKPYIFEIFQGGPDSLPPPLSGSAHAITHYTIWTYLREKKSRIVASMLRDMNIYMYQILIPISYAVESLPQFTWVLFP